jgi:NAD(P)-dependent dehydrogenase (short-subunit alcohol dehydrogenase family)
MADVVVITGAKGALGPFVTRAFLKAGAQVVGVSRSMRETEFEDPAFVGIAADLSTFEGALAMAEEVEERFGKIDVLVHLVGGASFGQPLAYTSNAIFERMIGLNVRTAFNVFRGVVPVMQRNGNGCVLAVGSRGAVEPGILTCMYDASQAALLSMVKTVALENGSHGIRANLVLSGVLDTPRAREVAPAEDPNKWVIPESVAGMLVYLASDRAIQVTGAVIPVFGGVV